MSAALLFLALTPAAPVPQQVAPVGPPPRLFFVQAPTPGQMRVYAPTTRTMPFNRNVVEMVNGNQVVKTVVEQRTVTSTRLTTLADAGGRVTAADGKSLSPEQVADRLRAGAVVVVPADGQPLHPAYRALLKPDALVLTIPGNGYPVANSRGGSIPYLVRLMPDKDGVVRLSVLGTPEPQTDDGKPVVAVPGQPIRVNRIVMRAKPTPVAEAGITGRTVAGKPLDATDVQKLSSGGVLLAAGPSGADAAFLAPFAADLPVLFTPQLLVVNVPGRAATASVDPANQLGVQNQLNLNAVRGIMLTPPVAPPAVPAKKKD